MKFYRAKMSFWCGEVLVLQGQMFCVSKASDLILPNLICNRDDYYQEIDLVRITNPIPHGENQPTLGGMNIDQIIQLKNFWMRHNEELPK